MPDTFPLTSIIIPNYNGLRFLTPCLDALRAQTYPREHTEIILVDDASTDSSVAFVAEQYPEVKIVRLAHNSGLAVGCNAGARAAAGELLVMLNNDTEVEPGWLAALVEAATAHPRAGAIASKMLLFDRRDTLHNAGDTMGADGIPRNRGVWEVDHGPVRRSAADFRRLRRRGDVSPRGVGADRRLRRAALHVSGGRGPGMAAATVGMGGDFAPAARLYHHLSATGGGVLASYYVGATRSG